MGFVTGVGAAGLRLVTNIAIDKLGVPTHRFAPIASGLILNKHTKLFGLINNEPKNTLEWGFGYVGDMFLGGVFGAGLSYIMTKTPPGNEVIKGVIKGTALGATTLVGGRYLRVNALNKVSTRKLATMMAMLAIFGGAQGWLLGKWGASEIVQSHPVLTKPVTSDEFYSTLKRRQHAPSEYQ